MKKILLILFSILLLSGCAATKYVEVPVDRVKVEYKNRMSIDTLYINDSIIIKERNDTVFLEKYKYLYKIREIKDTINITDTITVVKTVEVSKEVNRLYNWQITLMILGGVGVFFGIYKLLNIIKK